MNSSDTLTVRSGLSHYYLGLPMILALFGFATALLIDVTSSNVRAIAEGPPIFDGIHLLRTFLVAASSGLFVLSFAKPPAIGGLPGASPNAAKISGASEVGPAREGVPQGPIAVRHPTPFEPSGFPARTDRFIVWAMMVLSAAMVAVFLLSPETFYGLAKEDHSVEMLSGCIPLLSSALFLFISLMLFKNLNHHKVPGTLIALGFALAFFLIGMEEVSWFQRQLEIETPLSFSENRQNELNLHNFATNEIEILYYFSAFMMMVFLPFFLPFSFRLFPYLRTNQILRLFVPSPFIVYVGAIICAFNYDMWNMLPTQAAFFVSLFIIIHRLIYYDTEPADKTTTVLMIGLIVVTQGAFIFAGGRFVRMHDVTEYKELLIPLAYLIYTGDVIFKIFRESRRTRRDRIETNEAPITRGL